MQIMYGLHMEIMIKYIYEEKKACFLVVCQPLRLHYCLKPEF